MKIIDGSVCVIGAVSDRPTNLSRYYVRVSNKTKTVIDFSSIDKIQSLRESSDDTCDSDDIRC